MRFPVKAVKILYRDKKGKFVSERTAKRRGIIPKTPRPPPRQTFSMVDTLLTDGQADISLTEASYPSIPETPSLSNDGLNPQAGGQQTIFKTLKLLSPEQFREFKKFYNELSPEDQLMYKQICKFNPSWDKYSDTKQVEEVKIISSNKMYYKDIELFKEQFTDYHANNFQDTMLRQVFQAIRKGYKNIFILASKRHGKTTNVTILLEHNICFHREKAHNYFTLAKGLAKEKITPIVKSLSNPDKEIAQKFGPFRVPENAWTRDAVTVLRYKDSPDPTLRALGLDSSFTGITSDFLIIDDPCDSKMSYKEMETAHNTLFREVLTTRMKDSVTIVIMTRKASYHNNFTDLAECFLNKICPFCKGNHRASFKIFDYGKAIIKGDYEHPGPDTYELVEDDDGTIKDIIIYGDYEVRDPERWPIRDLIQEYYDIGPGFFKCEFQNDISEIQSEVFLIEHEQYWDTVAVDFSNAFILMSFDAAYATSKGADYTGGVALAFLPNRPNHIYVLKEFVWKKIINDAQVAILEEADKLLSEIGSVDLILVESIGQHVEEWENWAADQPVYSIECIQKKELGKPDRIRATLEKPWVRDFIWLCKQAVTLRSEMHMFPRGKGWHCLDAFEQAIRYYRYEYSGKTGVGVA